jgi:two-component system, sensor histidine kinase and response regulator
MSSASPDRTVLIVDDDADLRDSLAALLQAEGLSCVTAGDGEEALVACALSPPDLILLDIRMPGMDGLETCQHLKADPAWAEIPVIALTAVEEPDMEIRMREAGSVLYVTKPFSPAMLLSAVRLALGGPSAMAAPPGDRPAPSGAGRKEGEAAEAEDEASLVQGEEMEALLNVLVRKGIITRAEVLDEIQQLREKAAGGR